MEHISCDDFYSKFQSENLAMLDQEETSDRERSNFFEFVDRDSVDET